MAQQTPYIGSKISLISKLDIRYEGILYTVDSKESTIALSKVRSFGTEDRNAAHVVPPQDDVYDYIIFKANDIKDLIVCETPKPPAPGLPYDPAILSVSQGDKPPPVVTAAAPVGNERPVSSTATRRTSTPRNRPPSQSQTQQSQEPQNHHKNNDSNKPNNSAYRQGSSGSGAYQQRNNYQNRQHGGYEINRRGDNKQQQNRNYQPQNRNNHYNNYNRGGGNRGNGSNNRSGPRNNLKFDNDYDFEKAYEQFKETLEAIVGDVQNLKVDDSHSNDAGSVKSGDGNETFYDKNKSFFDNISCEALEKEEGMNTRPDWRKERLTNQETFGQQSVRSFGYRGGRGGYNRGGRYNYQHQNRNHYNNSNRGGNGSGGNRGNGGNNRSGQRNNLNC